MAAVCYQAAAVRDSYFTLTHKQTHIDTLAVSRRQEGNCLLWCQSETCTDDFWDQENAPVINFNWINTVSCLSLAEPQGWHVTNISKGQRENTASTSTSDEVGPFWLNVIFTCHRLRAIEQVSSWLNFTERQWNILKVMEPLQTFGLETFGRK